MERSILHSDLNAFYASVEMMLDPSLQGKAVAVCGAEEDRHGIVLAKSELAKKAGVRTGMVNWEAKRLCPGLILRPPRYDQYLKYAEAAREIYRRYTDQVEPFGLDECWLDVTASGWYGSGEAIAQEIRGAMSRELGLTVSVGVSFNKVYAKLGSDLDKPDAVTCVNRGNYKELLWNLPASEMIYVGRATAKKLARYGVLTIGDIAEASPDFLGRLLGVNGEALWRYASGSDRSRVMHIDECVPVKSVGRGITCTADLTQTEEVWRVLLELSQDIGHKLRAQRLAATGVQITVKDASLAYRQYQGSLAVATQSPLELAQKGRALFAEQHPWPLPVRAVTIRAINLLPAAAPRQLDLFDDAGRREKREQLDAAVEDLRRRFGKRAVYPACLMGDLKLPGNRIHEGVMPGVMYA